MAIDLSPFLRKDGTEESLPPRMEDLVHCIAGGRGSKATVEYIGKRQGLKANIERILECVGSDSRHEIELAAYFLFKSREARADPLLHRKAVEDWLEAERALSHDAQMAEKEGNGKEELEKEAA